MRSISLLYEQNSMIVQYHETSFPVFFISMIFRQSTTICPVRIETREVSGAYDPICKSVPETQCSQLTKLFRIWQKINLITG